MRAIGLSLSTLAAITLGLTPIVLVPSACSSATASATGALEVTVQNVDTVAGDVVLLYVPTGGGSPIWSSRPAYLQPGETAGLCRDPLLPASFSGTVQVVSTMAVSTTEGCRPFSGQVPVVLKNYQ